MAELSIYSPTRTDTWDRCALLSYLENDQHYVPKEASKKLVGGVAGTAFHLAASMLHKGSSVEEAVKFGIAEFHAELTHYATHGVAFAASIEEIVGASGIAITLPQYALADPFKGWTIQDIEQQLPKGGNCIIDLGGLDLDGVLSVADVKYKQNLDPRYLQSTIDEYTTSWQFLHYPWAYGEQKGNTCYRMYLCLVTYKPKFSVRLICHEVHPETQQIWLASARAKWARMADPDAQLEMASRHKDSFGICSFYKACFDYHLDEGLMQRDYVIVPRRVTT
jgi:hypothetical protein